MLHRDLCGMLDAGCLRLGGLRLDGKGKGEYKERKIVW